MILKKPDIITFIASKDAIKGLESRIIKFLNENNIPHNSFSHSYDSKSKSLQSNYDPVELSIECSPTQVRRKLVSSQHTFSECLTTEFIRAPFLIRLTSGPLMNETSSTLATDFNIGVWTIGPGETASQGEKVCSLFIRFIDKKLMSSAYNTEILLSSPSLENIKLENVLGLSSNYLTLQLRNLDRHQKILSLNYLFYIHSVVKDIIQAKELSRLSQDGISISSSLILRLFATSVSFKQLLKEFSLSTENKKSLLAFINSTFELGMYNFDKNPLSALKSLLKNYFLVTEKEPGTLIRGIMLLKALIIIIFEYIESIRNEIKRSFGDDYEDILKEVFRYNLQTGILQDEPLLINYSIDLENNPYLPSKLKTELPQNVKDKLNSLGKKDNEKFENIIIPIDKFSISEIESTYDSLAFEILKSIESGLEMAFNIKFYETVEECLKKSFKILENLESSELLASSTSTSSLQLTFKSYPSILERQLKLLRRYLSEV